MRKLVSFSLVNACSFVLCSMSFAGNTMVNSLGFKGTAMQAFVAVADDPSAIYYNPAGITQVKKATIEGDMEFYHPDVKYQNSSNGVTTTSSPYAVSPNLFYVQPINNDWYFGVGLYTPFARSTNYDDNAATASPLGSAKQKSQFTRTDLVPTIAWRINDALSIGLSAVVSYGVAKIDVWGLNESADGFGVTAQAGLLWHVVPSFRIGIDYRAPEKIHMDGTGSSGSNYPGTPVSGDFNTDTRYPGVFSAGFAWEFLPKWLLSFQYDYEMWSYVNKVTRSYSNTDVTTDVNGKNSSNYRLGLAYDINDNNAIYGGMSYNQAAIPANNLAPATPDYDAVISSLGYSYTLDSWQFNVAYEFAYLISRTSTGGAFPGQYYGHNQHLVLGINYSW